MKQDRRVSRTRQILSAALMELIIERGYEKISVQEILDRANCGRSTFYTHFNNKEDLLLSGFEAFSESMFESIFPLPADAGDKTRIVFGLALLRHIEENKQLARAMFGTEVWKVVSGHMGNMLVIYARKWVHHFIKPDDGKLPAEVMAQYLCSSLMGLLLWWVGRDFPYTADELAAMYAQLVEPGLSGL